MTSTPDMRPVRTFTAPDGAPCMRLCAFPVAQLPGELERLSARFPAWVISYEVIFGGIDSFMPYCARWTGTDGGRQVIAFSAHDLAALMRKG